MRGIRMFHVKQGEHKSKFAGRARRLLLAVNPYAEESPATIGQESG